MAKYKFKLTIEQINICRDLAQKYVTKLAQEIDKLSIEPIDKVTMSYATLDIMKFSYEKHIKELGINITGIKI